MVIGTLVAKRQCKIKLKTLHKNRDRTDRLRSCSLRPGGVLPSNRLMGMCRWIHDWIDYNGVAFSLGANRVTRVGSHICGISGVSKFRQVGIWDIFAQK